MDNGSRMKVLVLTNFYPPYTIGGMENRCQQVVKNLQKNGYETCVLTSIYGKDESSPIDDHIHRVLYMEADMAHYRPLQFFTRKKYQEKRNLETVKYFLDSFEPDVIFVWGMWNLSRKIPMYLEHAMPTKVVYSLASDWPAQPNLHESYWQMPSHRFFIKPFKYMVGKIALAMIAKENARINLEFKQVISVSNSLRDGLLKANIPLKNIQVIYPGIDFGQFNRSEKIINNNGNADHLSLLYAGALVPHKGVHSAIEAIAHILKARPDINLQLTVLGSGHPDYEKQLKDMVAQENLQDFVRFIPQIPRQEMPEFMNKHNILIFPSIWEEPFSRVILEAMASGLVVVGTSVGGTKEILMDGVNGLAFEPEDSVFLAGCIEKLYNDPELRNLLANNAYETITKDYDIKNMNKKIEEHLASVLATD